MQHLNLKPSHKPVKDYYATLGQFGQLNIDYEMAVRSAFGQLLEKCARQFEWTLVLENITDWVLEQFRCHYGDTSISK
ncbi:MAG TPA: hypothetical protein VJ756_04920 [Terriglobales bacterium]|nr:hypothetical protein [Terriglobales bacterium]